MAGSRLPSKTADINSIDIRRVANWVSKILSGYDSFCHTSLAILFCLKVKIHIPEFDVAAREPHRGATLAPCVGRSVYSGVPGKAIPIIAANQTHHSNLKKSES